MAGGWPSVGMVLIALVTLSAVHSVWWAIVPMVAGWTIWLATETLLASFHIKLSLSGGPLVAQIIVLTMPAASHLAIHFRDDRRREADPRVAARLTLRAVAAADLLDGHHRGHRLRGPVHQRPGSDPAVRGDSGNLHALLGDPGDGHLADRDAPPFPLEIPVKEGSQLAGRRSHEPADLVGLPPSRGDRRSPWPSWSCRCQLGIFNLSYETNYINLFRPETRVVQDYKTVESKLGGIGLVELVVPVAESRSRPGRWPN